MKSRNSLRRRRLLVCCLDLASRHLEGGKQRRRTVALVVVAVSRQCASVRQLQIALRALERLDRWRLVDAQNDRVSGGDRYRPTTSAALLANSGSFFFLLILRPPR